MAEISVNAIISKRCEASSQHGASVDGQGQQCCEERKSAAAHGSRANVTGPEDREVDRQSSCCYLPRGCNFAVSLEDLREHENDCEYRIRGSSPPIERNSDVFKCLYTNEGCDFHIGKHN
jgi:hypothetical protein